MPESTKTVSTISKLQTPRGLGRGLSALFGDEPPKQATPGAEQSLQQRTLPTAFLKPSRSQPRRFFKEDDLQDLANSIREHGILQPIIVRTMGQPDAYEIVAGERRWRAAQIAKLHEVPVIVRAFTDSEAFAAAIIENVQRADLNAIEEGNAYQELIQKFQYTQEQLSGIVGKSRSHIANTIRLLKLPDNVQALVTEGKLTAGHARTLVGVPDAEKMAREFVSGTLNVRQAEKKAKAPKGRPAAAGRGKDSDTKALETSLSNALGLNVQIEHKGERGGSVSVQYKTLEQLDEIIRRLSTFVEVD
jgi:ParB family transcriptional regulator, chromosome partitioning protein